MKVIDFLTMDRLKPGLKSTGKKEVLGEMAGMLEASGVIRDAGRTVEVLLEREKLGSTGIGEGIAIPHGKLPELENVVGVLGISKAGVDFESMDGEPVHMIFLLLTPEGQANLHLMALARVSRLLKSRQFRQELIDAPDAKTLFEKISLEDAKQQ